MRRMMVVSLVAAMLTVAKVDAQEQNTVPATDSVCLSVVKPELPPENQVLIQKCLLWNSMKSSSTSTPPAPLPGTGRKAQAVAAIDSARWYSGLMEKLDSARYHLTDMSSARTNAAKVAAAVKNLWETSAIRAKIDQWVARAIGLIDDGIPIPPVDTPPADTIPTTPPDTAVTPPDTTVTPPNPLPTPQGVELPRTIPPVPAGLEMAGCTVQVTSNLQTAINAAADGDVLCLSGTFVGRFSLPNRATPGWVEIRSANSVIPVGTRVRPSTSGPLATIRGIGVEPTIQTVSAARGWYLRELNIEADSAPGTVYSLINLARGASDIVLDRLWIHPPVDRQNQRCVIANAAAVTIINSWLGECHGKGFDSQAIITWDSPGPFKIVNNTLSGAGENFMSGGADPNVIGLTPSDITFMRNHVLTPLSWGPPGAKPTRWTKKNLLELKNARRVLIENNVFDGSWGDAQTGFAIVLKSANQSGRCTWCMTSHVTIRRNLIINSAAPLNISGTVPGTHPVDSGSRHILVEENYAETGGPNVPPDNRHLLFTGNSVNVTLRHNTWDKLTPNAGNIYTGSGTCCTTGTNWVIDGDLSQFGQYGVMGSWKPTSSPPGTINLTVLGLATYGSKAKVGQLPNMTVVPSLSAGVAAGFGVARSVVEAATAGVVVLP